MITTTFSNCIQSKVDSSDFDNFDEIKKILNAFRLKKGNN